MPTIIAIESKTVTELGVRTPYEHLYLVKRVTDDVGNVIDERVIRGGIQRQRRRSCHSVQRPVGRIARRARRRHAGGSESSCSRPRRSRPRRRVGAHGPTRAQHQRSRSQIQHRHRRRISGLRFEQQHGRGLGAAHGRDQCSHEPSDRVLPRDVPLYDHVGDMKVNDGLVGGDSPTGSTAAPATIASMAAMATTAFMAKSVTIPSLAGPVMIGFREGWERIVCAVVSATTPITSASATAC